MRSYSTIADAARSKRARAGERSQPASSSLLVAAARRLGDVAADRGPGRGRRDRIVGRRATRRGRDAALARVGSRAPRDARAASADVDRAARDRAGARRRRDPRRDRRITVDARDGRRVGRDDRVLDARVGPRHRVRGRERARVRRRATLPVARSTGVVPRPVARGASPRRGRGRGAGAAPGRRSRSSSASSRS